MPKKRKQPKTPMTVALVIDSNNAPGRVYAVFRHFEEAVMHMERFYPEDAEVIERTLLWGQQSKGSVL